MWIPLDALYSLRKIDLMIKYRQLALPCFNMCFVLHTRLDTFGVRRLFHVQDYHIQTNGAGKKEKMGHYMYVHWTDNNPIADVCHALKKCGCKSECSGRCTCKRTRLPCTSLCTCTCP